MVASCSDGDFDKASELIKQGDSLYNKSNFLRKISLDFDGSYNYLNSSNTVKRRIALLNNQIDVAKKHLHESGVIKSTPTLSSFGPNMSLANDFLEMGETQVVLDYLDQCKYFWTMDQGSIVKWKAQISNGERPEFGGNLRY